MKCLRKKEKLEVKYSRRIHNKVASGPEGGKDANHYLKSSDLDIALSTTHDFFETYTMAHNNNYTINSNIAFGSPGYMSTQKL